MVNEFDTPTNVMNGERLNELTERIRKGSTEIPVVIEMEAGEPSVVAPLPMLLPEAELELGPTELGAPLDPPSEARTGRRGPGVGLIALMIFLAIAPAATVICVQELPALLQRWPW